MSICQSEATPSSESMCHPDAESLQWHPDGWHTSSQGSLQSGSCSPSQLYLSPLLDPTPAPRGCCFFPPLRSYASHSPYSLHHSGPLLPGSAPTILPDPHCHFFRLNSFLATKVGAGLHTLHSQGMFSLTIPITSVLFPSPSLFWLMLTSLENSSLSCSLFLLQAHEKFGLRSSHLYL